MNKNNSTILDAVFSVIEHQ